MDLRANTAVDVLIGPFVDKTDGNTTEDSLTLTQAEIKLSKLGQGLTQKNESTSAAFDDDGYYNCMLDATDTNTEGQLVLIVHQSANALPVRHEFNVLSEAAWDSLYIAKDDGFMDVNIKTIGRADTQETEADNLETACANYTATRGLTGTAVPAAAADGAFGLPISDAGALDLDTKLANTNEVTAVRMAALTDWINGGRLDLLLDAILADTNELQADDVPTLIASVQSDTNDIQTRLPSALVNSRMDSAIDATGMESGAVDNIRDGVLPTQNVAFSNIEFLWVATSDHVTPVTAASGKSVTRSIDGGAFASATGTLAEVGNGIYQYDASQADMNGGIITFRFVATGGTPGAPDDRFLTIVTGGGV